MWHSRSKCWRIGASINANHKRLKAILALRIRNFGSSSVVLELVKFPLFDDFFPNLAEFRDLNVFSHFDFLDFLVCFTPFLPTPNLSTLSLPSFLSKTDLLLLFLHKADLLLWFLLGAGLLSDPIIFSIEVSSAIILLKPWINCQ